MMKSSSNDEVATRRGSRPSRTTWGILAFCVVAAIVAPSVYFGTRPKTVSVIQTNAEETLPSLIKVAPIGTGAILIEYTELLEDNSTIFYYLSAQDVTNIPDDIVLYLTRSKNPTVEDIVEFQARNLRKANETSLRIGLFNNLTFPFRLPDFFLPGDFNSAILVNPIGDLEEVVTASFSVLVDPEKNVGSSSLTAVNQDPRSTPPTTEFPTLSPSRKTTIAPSQNPTVSPTLSPSKSPTQSPSLSPSTSPSTNPTKAPSSSPSSEPTTSPIVSPTTSPTIKPSQTPTKMPTPKPTISPRPSFRGATLAPTNRPSLSPTNMPTDFPSQAPTETPTVNPTIRPSNRPSTSPSSKPTDLPSAFPTHMPTNLPTVRPTTAPTRNPTKLPTAEPTVSPTKAPLPNSNSLLPPILKSEISGSYSIDGSITIDYVQGFENGQVVDLPRLQFDIPNLSNAPGPYLYLSKRPYSETRGEDLEDEDVFIPIDSGEGGQFNVKGRFDQFLDEIENVQDLKDYTNGSWIVWCKPFGVWIGGGEISAL